MESPRGTTNPKFEHLGGYLEQQKLVYPLELSYLTISNSSIFNGKLSNYNCKSKYNIDVFQLKISIRIEG